MSATLRFTVVMAIASGLVVAGLVDSASAKKRSLQLSSSKAFSRKAMSNANNSLTRRGGTPQFNTSNGSALSTTATQVQPRRFRQVQVNSNALRKAGANPTFGRRVTTIPSSPLTQIGSSNSNGATAARNGLLRNARNAGQVNSNVLRKLGGQVQAGGQNPQLSSDALSRLQQNFPQLNPNPQIGQIPSGIGPELGPVGEGPQIGKIPEGGLIPEFDPPGDGPEIGQLPPGWEPPGMEPPGNDPPGNDPPGNDPPGNDPSGNDPPADPPVDPCPPHDPCPPWGGYPFPWPWPTTPCDPYYPCPQPPIITVPTTPVVVVDGEPGAIVAPAAIDLQLVDLRFVDPGDVARQLGPRYRVTLFNASSVAVTTPFEVALLTAGKDAAAKETATASSIVNSMAAGETKSVDVRLPLSALQLGRNATSRGQAFAILYAVVDSQNVVAEIDDGQERNNNLRAWQRVDIRPIDLTTLSAAHAVK